MATDSAYWRSLRGDFEGLPPGEFSLTWSSHLPMNGKGERLQSQWTWWRFPDESLRARLRSMALRGARALGHNSEDAWFDLLRGADFVRFQLAGDSVEQQPDGSMLESRDGSIDDVVKQSITLCHVLEAECAESLPKRSGRGTCPTGSGVSKPGPTQPNSATAVNGGDAENRSAADWTAIEIVFLSDERVQIRRASQTETCNYAELGFADRRIEDGNAKPNLAWVTLRAMAEQNGIIQNGEQAGAAWPKVEKRMQDIRRVLRTHFGLTGNPVPFVKGVGYEASFKIRCGPSFHT
jgi:hypothetical protein